MEKFVDLLGGVVSKINLRNRGYLGDIEESDSYIDIQLSRLPKNDEFYSVKIQASSGSGSTNFMKLSPELLKALEKLYKSQKDKE